MESIKLDQKVFYLDGLHQQNVRVTEESYKGRTEVFLADKGVFFLAQILLQNFESLTENNNEKWFGVGNVSLAWVIGINSYGIYMRIEVKRGGRSRFLCIPKGREGKGWVQFGLFIMDFMQKKEDIKADKESKVELAHSLATPERLKQVPPGAGTTEDRNQGRHIKWNNAERFIDIRFSVYVTCNDRVDNWGEFANSFSDFMEVPNGLSLWLYPLNQYSSMIAAFSEAARDAWLQKGTFKFKGWIGEIFSPLVAPPIVVKSAFIRAKATAAIIRKDGDGRCNGRSKTSMSVSFVDCVSEEERAKEVKKLEEFILKEKERGQNETRSLRLHYSTEESSLLEADREVGLETDVDGDWADRETLTGSEYSVRTSGEMYVKSGNEVSSKEENSMKEMAGVLEKLSRKMEALEAALAKSKRKRAKGRKGVTKEVEVEPVTRKFDTVGKRKVTEEDRKERKGGKRSGGIVIKERDEMVRFNPDKGVEGEIGSVSNQAKRRSSAVKSVVVRGETSEGSCQDSRGGVEGRVVEGDKEELGEQASRRGRKKEKKKEGLSKFHGKVYSRSRSRGNSGEEKAGSLNNKTVSIGGRSDKGEEKVRRPKGKSNKASNVEENDMERVVKALKVLEEKDHKRLVSEWDRMEKRRRALGRKAKELRDGNERGDWTESILETLDASESDGYEDLSLDHE